MRAILVHNETAGGGGHSGAALTALIEAEGYKVRYCDKAALKADGVPAEGADLIVVAGGDGTVAKVLTRLRCSVPIAILPLGTANNIARSLGIEGDPEALVAGWPNARALAFSVGEARGPWGKRRFVEAVGVGSVAEAIRHVDSLGGEETDGLRAGRESLRRIICDGPAEDLELTLDGERIAGRHLLAEIMNIGIAGPSIHLAPQSDPSDMALEVVLVGGDQREAMLAWLDQSHRNRIPPFPARRARKVSFCWRGAALRVDDSLQIAPKRPEKVKVRLSGEFLNLLVPAAPKPREGDGDGTRPGS